MRRLISLLWLIVPIYVSAQTLSLGVTKNMGWAEWTYETIEFRDDCTLLKGYFVPSVNGCWVYSKMNEVLNTDGKDYRIIYTTLPISSQPRVTYQGDKKVYFEEHFEPIFSTDGTVRLTSHDIIFPVPFRNRKMTKPFEDLLPAYENHIDTLKSKGKYDIAAYLLNKFVKDVWLNCTAESKKAISMRVLSKYRVLDFFLNASPEDGGYIMSQFKDTYHWLHFTDDDLLIKQLDDIRMLETDIRLMMNGAHSQDVVECCESLIVMIQGFGKYNKCYENALSLYRKALVIDRQTRKIPVLDKEIIEVCSHIYNPNDSLYLEHLANIASDVDIRPSKTTYETDCGINIWKEVRDKAKQFFPGSWKYVNALEQIADYNYRRRFYDVALMQYLSIDSLYQMKRNEWILELWYNHEILSYSQSVTLVDLTKTTLSQKIGYCYYQRGDVESAIKYDTKNPYYHYELGNGETLLALCKDLYLRSLNGLKGIVKKPTIISPGAYYDEVFDMAYAPALTKQIPYFAYKTKSAELCQMAYDGALITKEFRLTAGNRLRNYMRTTNDSISKGYSDRIDAKMQEYKSLIKRHDAGAVDNYWDIVHEQRRLMAYLDSIGVLEPLFPKWTEVCNALKNDELAIEFVEFPLWNQKQTMLGALVLRRDYTSPKMIPIFENSQLKQVSDTLTYQCQEMADLVWKPLEAELEGVKTIYFSPSGALYNIGIEYLPGMEDYDIYRVSSTRELVTREKDEPLHRAMLYGGLDYNAALDANAADKSVALLDESFLERANVRGMSQRGGREYLKQSKAEVDIINEELTKAGWQCVLDTAALGTEEAFKALSGRKIGWLHVATHGFYYTEEKADNARYQFMLMDDAAFSAEDRALTRSGLLLSGANHILNDEKLPDDVEDGVLTAREIADVDLRGLDLVVLSACQTGLGDIAQSEGVFGLQRGFKKAGANSILMSLWEVESDATMILMTQFYRNLLSGQGKRQALLSAQKYLRKVEGGKYDKPEYWAAFILLDGIEKQ